MGAILYAIIFIEMKSEILNACIEISYFNYNSALARKWPKCMRYGMVVSGCWKKGFFWPFYSGGPQLHASLHNYVAKLVDWPAKNLKVQPKKVLTPSYLSMTNGFVEFIEVLLDILLKISQAQVRQSFQYVSCQIMGWMGFFSGKLLAFNAARTCCRRLNINGSH